MTDLEKRILDEIEKRKLAPRPYAYFLAKRSVVWTLAVLSIVLGALSAAVLIFAVQDYFATGGRGFDDMPLDDVFEYLPIVWLATLATFLASAYFALRQTPGGYRFRTTHVLAGVLAVCALLGILLHAADTGRHVHNYLARSFPLYERVARSAIKTAPQTGRGELTGTVVSFDGKSSLVVKDFAGGLWTVDVSHAQVTLDDPLGHEDDVEIHGRRTGAATFEAQTIKDWD